MNDTHTSSEELGIQNIEFILENDFMIISLNNSISKNSKYELYIPFEAPLESGTMGYYKSSYIDEATNRKM